MRIRKIKRTTKYTLLIITLMILFNLAFGVILSKAALNAMRAQMLMMSLMRMIGASFTVLILLYMIQTETWRELWLLTLRPDGIRTELNNLEL